MPFVLRNINKPAGKKPPAPRKTMLPLPPQSQKFGEEFVRSGCIWFSDGKPNTPHPCVENVCVNGIVRKMTLERHRYFHDFCDELAKLYEFDVQADVNFPTIDAIVGYGGTKETDSFTEVMAKRLGVPQVRYATNDSGVKLNKPLEAKASKSKVLLTRLNIIGPEDPVFVVASELERSCNAEVIPLVLTLVNTSLKRFPANGKLFSVLSLVRCPIYKFPCLGGDSRCELCMKGSVPIDPRGNDKVFTRFNCLPFSQISPPANGA